MVLPYLMVNDANATLDLKGATFDAEELRPFLDEEGKFRRTEIHIDETVIMLADGCHSNGRQLHDVDALYKRAIEAGALSVQILVKKKMKTSVVKWGMQVKRWGRSQQRSNELSSSHRRSYTLPSFSITRMRASPTGWATCSVPKSA